MPGVFRLDVTLGASSMDASHEVEPSQYEPGLADADQPRRHVLGFELRSATLRLATGLSERWNLEIELPFRETSVDASFEDAEGQTIPDFPSIHHRTETVSGLGDAAVWLRTRLPSRGGWRLDLRIGTTAPTGNTEEDPFALGELGEAHQHVFFGSGTWDPQLALGASRAVGEWGLSSWLRVRAPWDTSSEGYRAGTTATLGLQAGRALAESRWTALANLQLSHEEPSRWNSQDARNSGRTDLILGAGIGWRSGTGWDLQALVLLPENLSARGGQIEPAPVLSLGIARLFGGG